MCEFVDGRLLVLAFDLTLFITTKTLPITGGDPEDFPPGLVDATNIVVGRLNAWLHNFDRGLEVSRFSPRDVFEGRYLLVLACGEISDIDPDKLSTVLNNDVTRKLRTALEPVCKLRYYYLEGSLFPVSKSSLDVKYG